MKHFTLLLMAATLAAPAFAQEAPATTPVPALMGLSPNVTNLLVDAGKEPLADKMSEIRRHLNDEEMALLETQPFNAPKLADVMKAKRVYEAMVMERADMRRLEAYLRMTPDERKSIAAANRKLRETMDNMKK